MESVHRLQRAEQGAVTAETAVVLPVLVLFTLTMAWLVGMGITQVRALDAARETVRAAARGESSASATGLGAEVAPAGSTITISDRGQTVVASVSSPVGGPAGLLRGVDAFRVRATAVAAKEPTG